MSTPSNSIPIVKDWCPVPSQLAILLCMSIHTNQCARDAMETRTDFQYASSHFLAKVSQRRQRHERVPWSLHASTHMVIHTLYANVCTYVVRCFLSLSLGTQTCQRLFQFLFSFPSTLNKNQLKMCGDSATTTSTKSVAVRRRLGSLDYEDVVDDSLRAARVCRLDLYFITLASSL